MSKRGNCKRFASETLAENVARALWEYLRTELDSDGDTAYGHAWLELEINWEEFRSWLGQEKVYDFQIIHDPVLYNGRPMRDEAEWVQIMIHLRKRSEESEWMAEVVNVVSRSGTQDSYKCIQQDHGHYSFELCHSHC